VILLNNAGGDFAPLHQNPNLTTTDQTPAGDALESVAVKAERCSAVLRAGGVSTWDRLSIRANRPTITP
jgi:hypothetical protein